VYLSTLYIMWLVFATPCLLDQSLQRVFGVRYRVVVVVTVGACEALQGGVTLVPGVFGTPGVVLGLLGVVAVHDFLLSMSAPIM
jgi:uncharacterized membrane protein